LPLFIVGGRGGDKVLENTCGGRDGLLVVDNFSRTVASFEVPISIFTTLIGGSFFVYLLKRVQDLYQLER
jgi:ABC-type Fe3+-siderophore transport system permease subunit